MISPSMKDGKKSSISHYPAAVTLLCANALRGSHLLQSLVVIKRRHNLLKAFNKFQALTYLHCFQTASTYSCKRKMMEEKLGRKKKYRMKTKDTEYFSFGISALYNEVLYAQTATEVNFGIFFICFY